MGMRPNQRPGMGREEELRERIRRFGYGYGNQYPGMGYFNPYYGGYGSYGGNSYYPYGGYGGYSFWPYGGYGYMNPYGGYYNMPYGRFYYPYYGYSYYWTPWSYFPYYWW